MTIEYLKQATKSAATGEGDLEHKVREMLYDIEQGGEQTVRSLASDFDQWDGEIVVTNADQQRAIEQVPEQLKRDIDLAHDHVRRFAEAQREAILDIEIEVAPGLIAGHRQDQRAESHSTD